VKWQKKLREAVFGVPDPLRIKEGEILIHTVKQSYGVRPSVTFSNQTVVYENDALVRQACIRQACELMGAGFFTQVNPEYKKRLPSPIEGIEDWDAKEAIDYYNTVNNIDELLQTVSIEMVAYGNSFLLISDGLRPIPLDTIESLKRRTKKTPIEKEYKIQTTMTSGYKTLDWGTFVHFRSNVTTRSAPFGEGIIAGLLTAYAEGYPSPLELRHATRKAMKKGFEKFSFGNELWCFPEASDPTIKKLNDDVKKMPDTGERVVTNSKGADIKIAVPQRTTSYDEWLKTTLTEFNSLLEDPALKIHTETIFAKATAEEEAKLFQKSILAKQRIIKRAMEALWFKTLTEWGFDAYKAKVRLNFGVPEIPEYKIEDILKAAETLIEGKPLISWEEARQMLRESRWKIVEGESKSVKKQPESTEKEGN